MTPQQRIKEFQTRQLFYDSSMTAKLSKKDGGFYYTVYAWRDSNREYIRFTVIEGKYNNEDPLDLIQMALKELGVRKMKLGVPLL